MSVSLFFYRSVRACVGCERVSNSHLCTDYKRAADNIADSKASLVAGLVATHADGVRPVCHHRRPIRHHLGEKKKKEAGGGGGGVRCGVLDIA